MLPTPSALLVAAGTTLLPQAPSVEERSSERPTLPDPAEVSDRLEAIVAAHPRIASLETYGQSADGRPLQALELALEGDPKPGLLVIAGLDPDFPFEPWLAVELAQRAAYAAEGDAAALLESYDLFVIPMADPDGHVRGARGGPAGHGPDADDDRDGRRGEDPPQDVNGDGWVLQLRVPDPEGDWIADPHDRRAALERGALEERLVDEPEWAALLAPGVPRFRLDREGRDLDADGTAGEDPAGDRRFDANFPAGWPEHAPRAGRYATEDPAARALCDWVLAHESLSVVVGLGAQDHLRVARKTAGKPNGRVPASGPMEADSAWLEALAERARQALGLEAGKGSAADDAGHFLRWAYDHRGLWTVGLRPWVLPTEAESEPEPEGEVQAEAEGPPEERPSETGTSEMGPSEATLPGKPSDDAGRLAWIEQQGESWRFVDWQRFEHPELGAVELGGFAPGAHSIPPRARWSELVDGSAAFLFALGDTPPSLRIDRCVAKSLGGGLWRVEAEVANRGYLPTSSAARDRSRQGRNAHVELDLPEGASLLSSRPRLDLGSLDGGASARFQWLVQVDDPSTLTVRCSSPMAGNDATVPTPQEAR